MRCDYFDRGECRSCTWMGIPHVRQVLDKEQVAREAVGDTEWLPPFIGAEAGFRNKAKLAVGGTVDEPTLGILDAEYRGIDLRRCGITAPGIVAILPDIARFIGTARLVPYDVAARRGELKHVIVTESPDGRHMVRFVLRSTESLGRIRKHLATLLADAPSILVVTANILPAHAAILEGEEEHVLTEVGELPMRLGDIELMIGPRSFFQTNTEVAEALYRQAQDWVRSLWSDRGETGADRPTAWDLYCGVGGFAMHLAAAGASVVGIESSADAIAAAQRAATTLGMLDATFIADDATRWAQRQGRAPDLVLVNPPRRGIGPELASWIDGSGAPAVIYSSCNPASLQQDLARMSAYRVREARLFDMFPHTTHMEVMVRLERR